MKNASLPLSYKVRQMANLANAWQVIYRNGTKADASRLTVKNVQKFKETEFAGLKSIQGRLKRKTFKFKPAKAVVAKKKKGGGVRPIVAADVEARIIQRAILDVLQSEDFIKPYLNTATSFGAIKGRGVPEAIVLAVNTIKAGGSYYIKSDIAQFFTKIPLPAVYEMLEPHIQDQEFVDLFKRATNIEIENLSQIEDKYKFYFEFDEAGTL